MSRVRLVTCCDCSALIGPLSWLNPNPNSISDYQLEPPGEGTPEGRPGRMHFADGLYFIWWQRCEALVDLANGVMPMMWRYEILWLEVSCSINYLHGFWWYNLKFAVSRKFVIPEKFAKTISCQFPLWVRRRMFGHRSHETQETGNYDRKGKIIRVTNVCVKWDALHRPRSDDSKSQTQWFCR